MKIKELTQHSSFLFDVIPLLMRVSQKACGKNKFFQSYIKVLYSRTKYLYTLLLRKSSQNVPKDLVFVENAILTRHQNFKFFFYR